MTEVKETQQGTCMYTSSAIARKVGAGWKVVSRVGDVFDSVRFGSTPGEKTNVVLVATKSKARKIIVDISRQMDYK